MHLNWCIRQQLRYLPIIARQDWVAVLNPNGAMVGDVQGRWGLGENRLEIAIFIIAY